MEKYPKFIIEDGNLILQKVTFHKEIVIDSSKVKGGGWFRFNRDTNTFTLYGESHDFGKAKFEDIKNAILNEKVFTHNWKLREISNQHNFEYFDEIETISIKIINPNQNKI